MSQRQIGQKVRAAAIAATLLTGALGMAASPAGAQTGEPDYDAWGAGYDGYYGAGGAFSSTSSGMNWGWTQYYW